MFGGTSKLLNLARNKITKINKTNIDMRFLLIFILSFSIISLGLSHSQASPVKSSPARIRSDVIDIKRKSEEVNFIKNVVVEKDDDSLLADKMTVLYFEKEREDQKSRIKRIDAKDNVKIFSDEFVGSGDYGYYDPDQNIFVLEKNVIINNGTSIASGDKFVYSLSAKKGKFIGKRDESSIEDREDSRVMVILGSDSKEIKKNKSKYEQ
jgi:lipopolysaccharide transport protein LptA